MRAVRRASTHPEIDAVLVLYLIDQAIERRRRFGFKIRIPMEDWTAGMSWAATVADAREAKDADRVLALLSRGSSVDALQWAVLIIREVRWAEHQHAADTLSGPPIGGPDEPDELDPVKSTGKPIGGWIQRFDPTVDWK